MKVLNNVFAGFVGATLVGALFAGMVLAMSDVPYPQRLFVGVLTLSFSVPCLLIGAILSVAAARKERRERRDKLQQEEPR